MKNIRLVKKSIVYILGLFVLAIGIAFSVKSNLGVSPVTSVPFVLGRIFGLSLGMATVLLYIFCMALQAVILRREYKPVYLFQIVISFVFGFFTDAALYLVSFLPVSDNYAIRLIYLVVGTCFIALGVLFYLTASLVSLPTDGTVQAIAYKAKFKLHKVKVWYDCISTAFALLLSLIVLHGIQGIGIGTVIAALGVGKMLGVFSSLLKEKLVRFLDGTSATKAALHEVLCTDDTIVKAG